MGKKGDETKRFILEKALSLFAEKGFKNVTMKDICMETGLSRGGLYRHYESTHQIFSEIVDTLMSRQDNELSEKMKNKVPAPIILDEILERYKKEMLDSSGSLSIAILEFYS
ncbi:TetR/AcrR family transcriptional regulator, partial [Blautia hydrogenotrophica]